MLFYFILICYPVTQNSSASKDPRLTPKYEDGFAKHTHCVALAVKDALSSACLFILFYFVFLKINLQDQCNKLL